MPIDIRPPARQTLKIPGAPVLIAIVVAALVFAGIAARWDVGAHEADENTYLFGP